MGFEGISGYIAAKHGQVGLMRAAAKEYASRRIRVNTLHPGPTSTAFQDDIEMRATGKPRDEAAKIFDQLVPLGRHTTPEEIAHAVLYLAADESAMMTSHTFAIDGGLSGHSVAQAGGEKTSRACQGSTEARQGSSEATQHGTTRQGQAPGQVEPVRWSQSPGQAPRPDPDPARPCQAGLARHGPRAAWLRGPVFRAALNAQTGGRMTAP